jgi:peptidoglycan/LPS O-acetylase OafA/YrhL
MIPQRGPAISAASCGAGINLPSLTSLRWFAAFLVFGFHVNVVEYLDDGLLSTLLSVAFSAGSSGVSFFFILSGFVLMWVWRPLRFGQFYRRRFARVYPLHLTTAILALTFLFVYKRTEVPRLLAVLSNVTLTHSWPRDVDYYQSLNTVSWTLSCEAFFYALFPILAVAIVRLRGRGLCVVGGSAITVVLFGPILGQALAGELASNWFFHWNPAGRLPEFVVGIVLARITMLDLWPGLASFWLRPPVAVTVAIAGYLGSTWAAEPYRYSACTLVGYALLVAAIANADNHGMPSLLRRRRMVWLGEISFAFYLVHLLTMRVVEVFTGYHPRLNNASGLLLIAGSFTISFAAAWALHVWVEQPAQRLLTRRRIPTQRSGRRADHHA